MKFKSEKNIEGKKGQTDLLHLPVVKVGKQYKKIQLTLWGDVCILIMPTGQQCYDCTRVCGVI